MELKGRHHHTGWSVRIYNPNTLTVRLQLHAVKRPNPNPPSDMGLPTWDSEFISTELQTNCISLAFPVSPSGSVRCELFAAELVALASVTAKSG